MDINDLRIHLDSRLDRIEDKLTTKVDNHEVRLIKTEEQIGWARGAVKFSLSIVLAVITGIVGMFWTGHK